MSETVQENSTAPTVELNAPLESPVTGDAPQQPAPTPVDSKSLLDLARKEAEWAKREVTRKEEISRLQEQVKELESLRSIKENYRSNPEEALARLGLSYEELTDAVIEYERNKTPASPEDTVKAQVEALLQEREAQREAERLQMLQKEEQETLGLFREEIKTFLDTNVSAYPYLSRLYDTVGGGESPEDLLLAAIEGHWQETGELLTPEQVAPTAESWFREQWERLNGELQSSKAPDRAQPLPQKEEVSVPNPNTKNDTQAIPAPDEPVTITMGKDSSEPYWASFSNRDYETPSSITNKLTRPKTRQTGYDPKSDTRRDAITQAVRLLETYEKNKRT